MHARSRFRSTVPLVIGFLLLGRVVAGSLWLVDRHERSFAIAG